MPAEKAIRSQGTTISYSIGSPTLFTLLAKVMGISGPNAQSAEIDQTDLDDTIYERTMTGLIKAGEVSLGMNLNPSDAGYVAMKLAQEQSTQLEIKITPPAGSVSLRFFAYVKSIGQNAPGKEKYTATLALVIDGGYVWA